MGDIHANPSLELSVEQTDDKESIRDVLLSDEVRLGFCSGFDLKELDRYIEELSSSHTCYLLKCKEEIAGICIGLNMDDVIIGKDIAVVDIGFFKRFRGAVSVSLCKMALKKFLDEKSCDQLVSFIKKKNRAAYLNARWLGFEAYHEVNSEYHMRYTGHGRHNGLQES